MRVPADERVDVNARPKGSPIVIAVNDAADEAPHTPGSHTLWQESAVVVWLDRANDVCGYLRLGKEPNLDGGTWVIGCGVMTRDGMRFRRNDCGPLSDADRIDDGLAAAGGRYAIRRDGENGMRVAIEDDGCRLDLRMRDFYPRTDFFGTGNHAVREIASNHFESSGSASGTLELAGRTFRVEALFHRDRSWGVRHWDSVLTHRWVVGTFGPELSFGLVTWLAADGSFRRYGYLVRDGRTQATSDVDVVLALEPDGYTYRAATAIWRLEDGETVELDCKPIDGVLIDRHAVSWIDAPSLVEWNGLQGFACVEASQNSRGGGVPIQFGLRAVVEDGLSQRVDMA